MVEELKEERAECDKFTKEAAELVRRVRGWKKREEGSEIAEPQQEIEPSIVEEPAQEIPAQPLEKRLELVTKSKPKAPLMKKQVYQPNLRELVFFHQGYRVLPEKLRAPGEHYHHVVGQEKALIVSELNITDLRPTSIEGPAGCGKSHILKSLISSIPGGIVYTYEFASDTVLFRDAPLINKHKILYIPEYQKALAVGPRTAEALKALTEGRPAVHRATNMGGNGNGNGKKGAGEPNYSIDVFEIKPICIFTSLADENENKKRIDSNKEDRRRFSHIEVDYSEEQIRKVRDDEANRSFYGIEGKLVPADIESKLKAHIEECINLSTKKEEFVDPFAFYINSLVPETKRSISYMQDYLNFVKRVTKWYFKERKIDETGKFFVTLEDHYIANLVYYEDFCKSLMMLDDLKELPNKREFDIAQCWESGLEKMKERYSEDIVEKWLSRQLKDGKIEITNPVTGASEVLIDYNSQ
jgi:hypothetical protein